MALLYFRQGRLESKYVQHSDVGKYTDKKEKKICLVCREIQCGAVARSCMRKDFLIYEEMRKYFPMYEEAVRHV
jgi:hypothetical protein